MNKFYSIYMLERDTFSIEGIEPFQGFHDPCRRWNGFAAPYFEWITAEKIAEWINYWSGIEQMVIDLERKIIIDLEDPESPFDIEPEEMTTIDGNKSLYPVGSGWWIWDIHLD